MLNHTPARTYTINMPDTFTDTETGEVFTVIPDEGTENPLRWYDDLTYTSLYGPPAPDTFCEVFAEYWDRGHGDERALELTNRYMRAFHGDTRTGTLHTVRGYSQGDWTDLLLVSNWPEAHAAHVREFEQWFRGDVWYVANDTTGEACGGIYADTPEQAVSYFREI